MKRFAALLVCAALAVAPSMAQVFPLDEDFSSYAPGSTGGPAWSALRSLQWDVEDGALRGPVFARFNRRPPGLFAADVTFAPVAASGPASFTAGFVFDAQDEKEMRVADAVSVAWTRDANAVVSCVPSVLVNGGERVKLEPVTVTDGPVHLRVAFDAGSGRFTFYVADKQVYTGPAEYPAGLFAVSVDNVNGSVRRVVLRAPNAEEKRSLQLTTLFNDPRDICDGGDGLILVLHRGSPAVLGVTPDGEVTKTYGRRIAGALTDPVAMAVSGTGNVYVLNRYPGEVLVYDSNGGIRRRFGKGTLDQPSDLAVATDGSAYVLSADPAGASVVAFNATGAYVGRTPAFTSGSPRGSIALTGSGDAVVTQEGSGQSVLMRPARDGKLATVRAADAPADDLVTTDSATEMCRDGAVSAWPPVKDGPAFHATEVGGLGQYLRLAAVKGQVYVLDRDHSRFVAVPSDLKDTAPEVSMQNIAGSSALVRWTSAVAGKESGVRVLRGSTWDKVFQTNPKPVTSHQVVLERLLPGRTYPYQLSPTVATVPPEDWSISYSFQTPGAVATEAKP